MHNSDDVRPSSCATLLVFLLSLCLVSCVNDDRMVTVSCIRPRDGVLVRLSGVASQSTALINMYQLAPGTILELDPPKSGESRGSWRVLYVLRHSREDFLPLESEAWLADILSENLDIEADVDVDKTLTTSTENWRRQIAQDIKVVALGAYRLTLRDPLGLLNGDYSALTLVKNGAKTSRFVIVTAASYGKQLYLGYVRPSVGVNIATMNKFYLHLKYTCSSITQITSKTHPPGESASVYFFYRAVEYDRTSKSIAFATDPADLTEFALTTDGTS